RDAFVAQLVEELGVGTDREFEAFVDFGTFMPPAPPVFIGMTQYDSVDDFTAAGEALGTSPEAGAFFASFTPEAFTALRPLEPDTDVDLAGIANGDGQVLEVAVRDLSTYSDFVEADYESSRDAFLPLLAMQPGFVAEFQWVSALDPNVVVGMTVYESADAFQTISSNPEFAGSAVATTFLGTYPPLVGYVSNVVK
ncbi:MAG: hypothetical protein AAF211_26120, partial [Myxococcota bacterium]